MSHMTFSGVASLDNGSICMRLTPNTSATPSNRPSYSASAATSTPWVCSLTRNDSVVLQAIVEDKVTVHESRLPMSRDSLRTLMNYVQRQLDMKVGIGEPWCAAADALLLRMLEKAKKKPSKKSSAASSQLSLQDDPTRTQALAIEDAVRENGHKDGDTNLDTKVHDDPNGQDKAEGLITENGDDTNCDTKVDDDHKDGSSDSDSSSSSSSLSPATVRRFKRADTSQWTTGWHDMWKFTSELLDTNFHIPKRRRRCQKLLRAIHYTQGELVG